MRGSLAPLISCCGYPSQRCECPSAAAHSPGGSGAEGRSHTLRAFATRSPVTGSDIAEYAITTRGSRQSSDDCLNQQTNVDRIFHEGEFICR